MSGGDGYPLDLASPVSHVAVKLDGAAPAALSLAELTAGYRHPNTGDLARVRNLEGCEDDDAATAWLIKRAVEEIAYQGKTSRSRQQVEQHDGVYRLVDGLRLDGLRWKGQPVYGVRDAHAQFGDPFNPMSGAFAENIRTDKVAASKDDMEDLRESMRSLGWVPEFPALLDRRGVVLVGHRRLKVAEELGIPPVKHVLQDIGDGDEHDARRYRIALASNTGFKPMSPTDKKRIAVSLRLDGWSQARIGEVLGVSQKTVSGYTQGITAPKSRGGRPPRNRKDIPEMLAEVDQLVEAGQPVSGKQLGAKYGVHPSTVEDRAREARARVEERERLTGVPSVPSVASSQSQEPEPMHTCTCPSCGNVHANP